jgi:DNA-binding transcriptional ArsR family regulator
MGPASRVEPLSTNVDMADLGRLLAVRSRAAMLDALFDGRSWSVGELAAHAHIGSSTASEHLERLRFGGLVAATRDGRQRRYRLASPEVADALEALGVLARPLSARNLGEFSRNQALRAGRTCYDHLAGRLGVSITDGLVAANVLLPPDSGLLPTTAGWHAFARVGIDVDALASGRRPLSRACQDWSEKRPHLAGALGAALLRWLEDERGLERLSQQSRAVRLRPVALTLLAELGVAQLAA